MYGKSIDRIPPDFRRKLSRQPVKRASECSSHLNRYGHAFLFRNIDKRPARIVKRTVRKIRHMLSTAGRHGHSSRLSCTGDLYIISGCIRILRIDRPPVVQPADDYPVDKDILLFRRDVKSCHAPCHLYIRDSPCCLAEDGPSGHSQPLSRHFIC